MALTAGTASVVSVQSNTAVLSATAATAGTNPVTYQWYRSTTTGFTPGSGNLISGATSLQLNDTGLIPNTTYYYILQASDASPTTVSYAQVSAVTTPQQLSQNQFAQVPIAGQVDLPYSTNTLSCVVDVSQSGVLYPGQAVKIVGNAGPGVSPHVVACTADTDECIGFVEYDNKQQSFSAGSRVSVSSASNVIYLYATTAVNAFQQVQLDITPTQTLTSNGVKAIVGSSGANIVGYAVDYSPTPGSLIRVKVTAPSFAFA
jgi:hypothetical protein